MNELDLVEKFRDDMPTADPAALNRARARMFHGPAARRRARWQWGLVPAGALAAVVAGAVAINGMGSHALIPVPQTAQGSPGSGGSPTVATDAAGVLRLAAAEVRTEPVLPARPDQFVYVESLTAYDNVDNLEKKPTYVPPKEIRRKVWMSVDGSRAGLLSETVVKTGEKSETPLGNGVNPSPGANAPQVIGLSPAYLTNLPTGTKAMRDWLYQGSGSATKGNDTTAWTKIGDTLREQYVTPAEQAAMFEAAATIPGVAMVKQADLAGRAGIAVSRTSGKVRFDYIFDAKTYDYLGERVVVVGHLPPYPKGAVSAFTAQLRVAIVDRTGQLP